MADLSPTAEAIWEAFNDVSERVGVFEDYGDALAAALEALAEYVVLPNYQYADWEMAHKIHGEITAIAAELRGANHPIQEVYREDFPFIKSFKNSEK